MAEIMIDNIISEKEHDIEKIPMMHLFCLIPYIIETHSWYITMSRV